MLITKSRNNNFNEIYRLPDLFKLAVIKMLKKNIEGMYILIMFLIKIFENLKILMFLF